MKHIKTMTPVTFEELSAFAEELNSRTRDKFTYDLINVESIVYGVDFRLIFGGSIELWHSLKEESGTIEDVKEYVFKELEELYNIFSLFLDRKVM